MEGGNTPVCGVNLLVSANDNSGIKALQVDGRISMASTRNGAPLNGDNGRYAGENKGGGTVQALFTYIREKGYYSLQGSSQWNATPLNSKLDDGAAFIGPTGSKLQPPPPTGLTDYPILGNTIIGSPDA
jgi:hypothetical protein